MDLRLYYLKNSSFFISHFNVTFLFKPLKAVLKLTLIISVIINVKKERI